MKADYTLAYAGTQEEEAAHLRLLLRALLPRLPQRWTWTEADQANVVICDPADATGRQAQRTALQRSQPCIVLSDNEDGDLALARPLSGARLFKVLQAAARRLAGLPPGITQGIGDFFDHLEAGQGWKDFVVEGLINSIPDARPTEPGAAATSSSAPASAPSDAAAQTVSPPVGPPTEADTAAATQAPQEPQTAPAPAVQSARAGYPLREYLVSALIGVPSQIAIPGAPSLVLIPATRSYFSLGNLDALEPYFRVLLPRTEWRALTPTLLSQIRANALKSYDVLLWRIASLETPNQLAAHLDPGATYRLAKPLNLADDSPRAQRILSAMGVPQRLHQIATNSGTSVSEVYTVVNALEAIGHLEFQGAAKPRGLSS